MTSGLAIENGNSITTRNVFTCSRSVPIDFKVPSPPVQNAAAGRFIVVGGGKWKADRNIRSENAKAVGNISVRK